MHELHRYGVLLTSAKGKGSGYFFSDPVRWLSAIIGHSHLVDGGLSFPHLLRLVGRIVSRNLVAELRKIHT
jgi:hypothetical protein